MQGKDVGGYRYVMKTLNTKSNLVLKFYYNYQRSVEHIAPCHCLTEAHVLKNCLLICNGKPSAAGVFAFAWAWIVCVLLAINKQQMV